MGICAGERVSGAAGGPRQPGRRVSDMKISVERQVGVAVMGGGAAGMAAAVAAARALQAAGVDVAAARKGPGSAGIVIFERNKQLGRKLLTTGNGRCNFTNSGISAADYRGRDGGAGGGSTAADRAAFAGKVLEGCGPREIREFFESVGVFSREEEEGRVYPWSGQAASLRDALETELALLGVETVLEDAVTGVDKRPEGFALALASGRVYMAERLIVATGGKAGIQYGSTGDGYGVAKSFGHRLAAPGPALVQMAVDQPDFAELKGVRAPGRVALLEKGRELARSTGEIQFTEKTLSGICVFDLSGLMERQKSEAGDYEAEIDLFPELSTEALYDKLRLRQEYLAQRPAYDFLDGVLPKKLCAAYIRRWTAAGKTPAGDLSPEKMQELAELLKGWRIPLTGTKGWAEAQVTTGGVELAQVNPKTLESRLTAGLHFAGEILDADGPCGGWNLHWAWASGLRAGQAAAKALLY